MSKNFDWEVYLLNYPDLVDLKPRPKPMKPRFGGFLKKYFN